MKHQITSYLKFLSRATNAHGVHSPFVYDLITKCFYDKAPHEPYKKLSSHRKKLLQSSETISIVDFGAGSRVFKSNERNVKAIAKNAGMSSKRQLLLYRIMKYFNFGNALELGTSVGLATTAMALGNPAATITTVEGCTETSKIAQEGFDSFEIENIQLINTTFDSFFESIIASEYQLIFIDGNHNKEMTLLYFDRLLKHISEESVLIFDDIYWSVEMTEAWNQIIEHKRVTVSIDTFQWGIVFFRKGQVKEHFSIRV